ncbi:voltage-gated sodium channel [Pseudorhodobacter antarcticus]|jgi:voltage-gated sodium channel|uniref:Voltage-gated sodium channel n=1 Tax=Pseudorhodobacter antarcticus TaxID=1077947 RepID=A0A1H8C321_9RHOB|nr:ion transporter [Pseudorhodobacter antarcticus]SEM89473.1 voltage-gated sodium channel [Pseudorhodobacter antarcticus]
MTLRQRVAHWIDHPLTQRVIIGVILFNAVLLGLETSQTVMATYGPLILLLDTLCLTIFIVEITLKLFAHGWRFFKSGWNIFDFVVIGIAIMPGAHSLSVLRAMRILRVLRVISVVPSLRRVVEGFVTALPGMGSVFVLMAIIFYIGAVMSTKLFGADYPEWFGTMGRSAYSLFQIMTLESWSMGIVRPIMADFPYAWAFFIPFIMMTTFAVVNLLVGLIVNSMQDAHNAAEVERTDQYREDVINRLAEIERHLGRLDRADGPKP